MLRVFISYRRDDSAGHTGRLYDRLTDHFGQGQIFMDVDTIQPGLNYFEVVQEAVSACDGLVAVIGRDWLQISDAAGVRRLEDPADLVKLEIATALERGIPVIPVLVHGAQMPRTADLPDGLKELGSRNALEVSDTRFRADVDRLIEALEAGAPERLADSVFVEPAQLASSTFVGRERELGELGSVLAEALAGHGRLVMLVGEAGIGKTRTAQELASRAEAQGAQVFWGRCVDEEGAPPYWPWVQPIRAYVQQIDSEQLRSQMGPGAADIAEVVPELRDKLPGLEPPPALEPEQARFRLFDSITTLLKNAAQARPLMLVLDDLHWADKPSLLLLQFVAREMSASRLLIVGTYRDVGLSRQHPLSDTLAQLTRESVEGRFRRVLLRGLSHEDTGRFIEATANMEARQGLVEAIYARTEGNPFFMAEVVRLLAERGELASSPATATQSGGVGPQSLSIPEGIREVIGQRLNRLSQESNGVLTSAAVLGREFTLEQLNRLIDDLSEDRLLEMLEEALEARVIEEIPRTMGRYQFTHALIQETCATEMSATRRGRLHGRIAEALEALYGVAAKDHAAELAYHLAEAGTATDTGKLTLYRLLAGERDLAAYSYEAALAHFQRALDAKQGQPTDLETAALLSGLGRAQAATLQHEEARASLNQAFEYYVEVGDVPKAVAVAEYPLLPTAGLMRQSQLVVRALTLVPSGSLEEGRLLSTYGLVLYQETGEWEGPQDAFSRAMAIARSEGDPALEMRTLASAADVDWYHLRVQEIIAEGRRTIELSQSVDDPRAEVRARYYAALAHDSVGDRDGMRLHAAAMLVAADKLRDRAWLANALSINGNMYRREGNWQMARDFMDRGLEAEPQNPLLLNTRAVLEYEVGNFHQGQEYLERLIAVMRSTEPGPTGPYVQTAMAIPVVARITGRPDWSEVARSAADAVLSSPFANPGIVMRSRVGLAMLAVQRDDGAVAREQYSHLEPLRGVQLAPSGVAGTDRLLGLLRWTMGNLDQAMAHFEEGLGACRKAGYRPELAWTCCDYSDMLRERDAEGDRSRVITLLDESLAISSELGMRPLMERVLSRREILGA